MLEWRLPGADWKPLKQRKIDDFEAHHAWALPAEAALLWQPFWQRTRVQYAASLKYHDGWVREQAGRWLRQPLLRPLMVNADGEPLVFHAAPLQWQMTAPADPDGDYVLRLVQADGQPVQEMWMAMEGHPVLYLTGAGVFSGPPFEYCVMSGKKQTLIPAKALESVGGARLLDRLQIPPPPRLAARVRHIKLLPTVRAEIKGPWAPQASEYCHLEILGAAADGSHAEFWNGQAWRAVHVPPQKSNPEFIKLDRAGLNALIPPLEQAGFKWDYDLQNWQMRVTKKFAETFVAFLKGLPAETRIELRGELASFQNAEVAGKIRLEASEKETGLV